MSRSLAVLHQLCTRGLHLNLHMRDKYTNLTDTQLDTYTEKLHNNHNNAGNEVSHYCTGLYCTVYATCYSTSEAFVM